MKDNILRFRMIVVIAIAFLSACPLSAQNTEDQVISNGDFEEWEIVSEKDQQAHRGQSFQCAILADNLIAKGFGFISEKADDPPGVKIVRDADEKHSGMYSVRMENTDNSQNGSVSTKEIPISPSSKYKVSMWYKISDVKGAGVIVWISHGPKKTFWEKRQTSNHRPQHPTGTSDWQECEFTFETLPDSETGLFTLQLQGASGTAWFDDFSITRIGEAKPAPNF